MQISPKALCLSDLLFFVVDLILYFVTYYNWNISAPIYIFNLQLYFNFLIKCYEDLVNLKIGHSNIDYIM